MFLTSFIILASVRLNYRSGVWPAILSLLLSLWALRDSYLSHHAPFPLWLASAAWTIMLIGASRRHRPWFILIPLLPDWTGALTGAAICLPLPKRAAREAADELGYTRI